jgi:hypothetical protein
MPSVEQAHLDQDIDGRDDLATFEDRLYGAIDLRVERIVPVRLDRDRARAPPRTLMPLPPLGFGKQGIELERAGQAKRHQLAVFIGYFWRY